MVEEKGFGKVIWSLNIGNVNLKSNYEARSYLLDGLDLTAC